MTRIGRSHADLIRLDEKIRANPSNPRHPCAIVLAVILTGDSKDESGPEQKLTWLEPGVLFKRS
jgi:hypothetical protein